MTPRETQRLKALERGNEVRAKRKQLKADLKAGRVLLADALFSGADYLQTMRVRDLLLATPKIGKHKADRALRPLWLSQTTLLNRTSHKSREQLLEWIAEQHPTARVGHDQATPSGCHDERNGSR